MLEATLIRDYLITHSTSQYTNYKGRTDVGSAPHFNVQSATKRKGHRKQNLTVALLE